MIVRVVKMADEVRVPKTEKWMDKGGEVRGKMKNSL